MGLHLVSTLKCFIQGLSMTRLFLFFFNVLNFVRLLWYYCILDIHFISVMFQYHFLFVFMLFRILLYCLNFWRCNVLCTTVFLFYWLASLFLISYGKSKCFREKKIGKCDIQTVKNVDRVSGSPIQWFLINKANDVF